ncbi:SNF2 family N-terminal domain-containing protein, partial [Gorgonomyces haynaldii]
RQPSEITGVQMRDYQIIGMEWMISLYDNGLNGILGDEMGLGKTLQTIAFLAHLREMGTMGPFLIVAPLSTISNWVNEIERFAPTIPTVMYHGTPKERQTIRNKKLKFKTTFPIVVTSYEICMNDRKHLQGIRWKFIVVDEGHRLKNLNCKLIKELKSYHSANRLLLTGTPLQNNLSELWSLLNFLMPDIFDDLSVFEKWFEFSSEDMSGDNVQHIITREQEEQLVGKLHSILRPFLLRRVKTEVLIDLPLKREYLLYCPFTQKQRELYDAAVKGKLAETIAHNLMPQHSKENMELTQSSSISRLVGTQNLQSLIVQLRKICNHPYLFNISNESLDDKIDGEPEMLRWSGKMKILNRLLPKLLENGHKVLLFSQMTRMLDIIADYCEFLLKLPFCRIDGQVKMDDRRRMIQDFNTDPNMKLFLLSTRAGGLGINLTSADTVIIFDSDWNPQADLQAQDRVHRIGQTKPVIVYRFVTEGTVEKKIIERASGKRKLEKLVIHKGQFKGSKNYYQSNKLVEPSELYDILHSQDLEEIKTTDNMLTDQDLELIMDRRPEAYEKAVESDRFDIVPEVVETLMNN